MKYLLGISIHSTTLSSWPSISQIFRRTHSHLVLFELQGGAVLLYQKLGILISHIHQVAYHLAVQTHPITSFSAPLTKIASGIRGSISLSCFVFGGSCYLPTLGVRHRNWETGVLYRLGTLRRSKEPDGTKGRKVFWVSLPSSRYCVLLIDRRIRDG